MNATGRCKTCGHVVCIMVDRLKEDDPQHYYGELAKWATKYNLAVGELSTEGFRALPTGDFGHTVDCAAEPSNMRRAKRKAARERRQTLFKNL